MRPPRLLLVLPLVLPLALAACTRGPGTPAVPDGYTAYGDAFAADDAVPVQTVAEDPDRYTGQAVTIEGTVHEVCQKAGCWLTLDAGTAGTIRIRVPRDESGYVFTVPTDISGRRVVVRGLLEQSIHSAGEQAHLLEDAGRTPPDDLHAVAELQLAASGVLVPDA